MGQPLFCQKYPQPAHDGVWYNKWENSLIIIEKV